MDQLTAWSRRQKCNPLWGFGGGVHTRVMATKTQSLGPSGIGEITSSLGGVTVNCLYSLNREREGESVHVNKNYKMLENALPYSWKLSTNDCTLIHLILD